MRRRQLRAFRIVHRRKVNAVLQDRVEVPPREAQRVAVVRSAAAAAAVGIHEVVGRI